MVLIRTESPDTFEFKSCNSDVLLTALFSDFRCETNSMLIVPRYGIRHEKIDCQKAFRHSPAASKYSFACKFVIKMNNIFRLSG